jgi:hypothetical protein
MPTTLRVKEAFLVGLVLGDAQDRAALAVFDRSPGAKLEDPARHRLRQVRRWPLGTPYPVVVQAVRTLLESAPLKGETGGLVVDATGISRPVVDVLSRAGLAAPVWPVAIAAGGHVWGDDLGWHVPLRDLVGSLAMLLQARRFVMADGLAEAAALRADLRRFLDRGAEGDAAAVVARADGLVLAVALVCWWGEAVSPGLVELVPGEFGAWSAEARRYEYEKRRIKGQPTKPTGPLADGIG